MWKRWIEWIYFTSLCNFNSNIFGKKVSYIYLVYPMPKTNLESINLRILNFFVYFFWRVAIQIEIRMDLFFHCWCQSVKLSENETNWHHQFLTYIMYLSYVTLLIDVWMSWTEINFFKKNEIMKEYQFRIRRFRIGCWYVMNIIIEKYWATL